MIDQLREVVGTGEFFFCPNARTLDQAREIGWVKFQNLANAKISPEIEFQEHMIARRGVNTRGAVHVTSHGLSLMLEAHDISFASLAVLFGGSSKRGGKQEDGTNQASAACEVISSVPANYMEVWFPIKTTAGVRLKNLTSASFVGPGATPVTDYELDSRNGMVRFKSGLSAGDDVTPTAAADGFNSEAALQGDTALRVLRKSGLGRFVVFSQEGDEATGLPYAPFLWNDFSCEITVEGSTDVDPSTPSNINIKVDVSDLVGTAYIQRL